MLAYAAIGGMIHCINIHFICIIIHKPDVKVYRWPRHCIIGNRCSCPFRHRALTHNVFGR